MVMVFERGVRREFQLYHIFIFQLRHSNHKNITRFDSLIPYHLKIINTRMHTRSQQVDQGEGERNYHIFYFLIKGATKEEQSMFNFKNVADYGMLMHGHTAIIDNETDKDTGKNTYDEDRMNNALNPSDPDETGVRAALTMANVDETQQAGIWKVLVGLLLMGELKFKALGDDKSEVKEKDQVPVIEKYLGIEHLAENLVIFRRIIQKKALDST